MNEGTRSRKSRRALLSMAVAAGAVAVGTRVGRESRTDAASIFADENDPLLGGQINAVYASDGFIKPGATTRIFSPVPGFSVLQVSNTAGATAEFAPAIQAIGQSMGLVAYAPSGSAPTIEEGDSVGVRARGGTYGVQAEALNGAGVYSKGSEHGVLAEAELGEAVKAVGGTYGVYSTGLTGVYGHGTTGVQGSSLGGTAVLATLPNGQGIALDAQGPIKLKSSGTGKVVAGKAGAFVNGVSCPEGSRIIATVNANAGPGNGLRWAKRRNNTSIHIKLIKKTAIEVPFSYLIIHPDA